MSISFIVPVYNTKVNLLKRCVLSIEKLKISDYEIIIINDGSDDNFTQGYKDFLADKRNVIYIKNKNMGVSHSRNCGISRATKEYVTFVDSDDIVVHEFFKESNIDFREDIILLTYHNKTTNRNFNYSFPPGLVTINTLLREAVSTSNFCGPVAKLFKRRFLINHSIMFNESFVQGEDALFNLCCLECNPTIRYYDILFYEYDFNSSSIKKRWKNNFKKCLDNKYYIYSKKQELISSLCTLDERGDLFVKNDNEFVRSVFHSYMLLVAINDNEKIKEYVKRFKYTNIKKKELGLKEKLYCVMLLSDSAFTRRIVNLLRKK